MDKASILYIQKKRDEYPDILTFPKEILVDSSFIISTYGNSTGNKNWDIMCGDFLKDCIENDTALCITPDIYQEVLHAHKNAAMRNVAKKNGIEMVRYPNSNCIDYKTLRKQIDTAVPNFSSNLTRELDLVKQYLQTMYMLEYINNEEFNNKLDDISSQLDETVNSDDIKHVLVAHDYGINTILALDGDFYRFDNLNVLTVPKPWLDIERLSRRNTMLSYKDDEV